MRRVLPTFALIALLLASATPFASAQEGDMVYFEEFDGLQRIIARSWMAPLTYSTATASQTVEINEQGTPVVVSESFSTPAPSPEPVTDATVGQFTAFVYLFDSDEDASAGLDRIDDEMQETIRRDPRAPMTDDLPLDGIGDRAIGYMGDLEQDDVTVTYAFANVQDGPFVYQLFAMTANAAPVEIMRDAAEALVRQPMNRMAEQYDPEGGSRGGLWSKLDSLDPDVPDNSTVTDLIIYPMPEATPGASPVPEPSKLDLDDPGSIAGLASLDHKRYTSGDDATPAPDVPDVFRIDAWILTFDTVDQANDAASALSNTLIEPFGIFSGGAGQTGIGDPGPRYDAWLEGYIEDRSLPAGIGTVVVRQVGTTLVGVTVYAIEEEPHPVAEDIADELLESGFPETGNPVLQGLSPSAELATPPGQ